MGLIKKFEDDQEDLLGKRLERDDFLLEEAEEGSLTIQIKKKDARKPEKEQS